MKYLIFTDGASRGNPGPAAYGFIIKDEQGVILHQEGQCMGQTTNNVAEYTGVLKALEYVSLNLPTFVEVAMFMDSQLVARQLEGVYKIKNIQLMVIYQKIKKLEALFNGISYTHIPRAENFIADKLANRALDGQI
jgi:ribonuclease HI